MPVTAVMVVLGAAVMVVTAGGAEADSEVADMVVAGHAPKVPATTVVRPAMCKRTAQTLATVHATAVETLAIWLATAQTREMSPAGAVMTASATTVAKLATSPATAVMAMTRMPATGVVSATTLPVTAPTKPRRVVVATAVTPTCVATTATRWATSPSIALPRPECLPHTSTP